MEFVLKTSRGGATLVLLCLLLALAGCGSDTGSEAARQEARQQSAQEARLEAERQEEAVEAESSDCDPSYSGACLDPYASDYDCEGGSGDGPYYTGPVEVVGYDHFGLDGDNDGHACEWSG
jgi:hypothetical protein